MGGKVTLIAGNAYQQVGSDVMAPGGDVNILAKQVDIVEARETSASQSEQKFKQSAITVSVGSPVLRAINQAQSLAQAVGNTSDARMQALAGASTAFNLYNNADAIGKSAQALASGNPARAASITLSIGSSRSQSNASSQSNSARGSSVTSKNWHSPSKGKSNLMKKPLASPRLSFQKRPKKANRCRAQQAVFKVQMTHCLVFRMRQAVGQIS